MVGEVLVDDHLGGLVRPLGIRGVQLQAARVLVVGERGHVHGLFVALHQGARRDHLADVEAGDGAHALAFLLAAERAERHVGHARHGGEHDGGGELVGADAEVCHGRIVAPGGCGAKSACINDAGQRPHP